MQLCLKQLENYLTSLTLVHYLLRYFDFFRKRDEEGDKKKKKKKKSETKSAKREGGKKKKKKKILRRRERCYIRKRKVKGNYGVHLILQRSRFHS